MKKLVSLFMAVLMVLTMSINAFAGTSVVTMENGLKKRTPVSISYKDLKRITGVAQEVNGVEAVIVNAQPYNGDQTTWAIRMVLGEHTNDYIVTCVPYVNDNGSIKSLPFGSIDEGTAMFSPNWYYVACYDDTDHNIMGYMIVSRIKRWSAWSDLTFNGSDRRNVNYAGTYTEPSSATFIEEKTGELENIELETK